MHGNCSSRLEALPAVNLLLPQNISVFTFDFSGCGLSEGEFISLGWHEKDDLDMVIDYLRSTETVACIGLWGRSMGAVTSILHASREPLIAGMVLDSPFSNLTTLSKELVAYYTKIPAFIANIARKFVRKTVMAKANFDISLLNPIEFVPICYAPALFVVAKGDDFVMPHHGESLHAKYGGDKNLIRVEGDHNSDRPQFFLDSVSIFFYNTLGCDRLPPLDESQLEDKDYLMRLDVVLEHHQKQHLKAAAVNSFKDEDDAFKKAVEESFEIHSARQEKEKRIDQFFADIGKWKGKENFGSVVEKELDGMGEILNESERQGLKEVALNC